MQKSFMLILAVLVISVLADGKLKDCRNLNPILADLQKLHPGVVLESPAKYPSVCGGEWNTHGSCCDINKITELATKDAQKLKDSISSSQESFTKFSQTIVGISTFVPQIPSQILPILPPDIQQLINFLKGEVFQEFSKLSKSYIDEKTIATESEKCWTAMSRIRSSSLCWTCSGRSEEFFYNGKAIISNELCQNIIGVCEENFLNTIKLINVGDRAIKALSQLSFGKDIPNIEKFIDKVNYLIKITRETKITELLIEYKSVDNRGKIEQKGKVATEVCDRMIKLHGDELLIHKAAAEYLEMRKILATVNTGVEAKINEFKQKLMANMAGLFGGGSVAQNDQEGEATPSHSNYQDLASLFGRRLLKTSQSEANKISKIPDGLFNGDTFTLPPINVQAKVDSSWTSYQGALGTKGNEGHKFGHKPMNMVVHFP